MWLRARAKAALARRANRSPKGAPLMTLGYDQPLYILAFDHRGSFQKKFFGISGEPTPVEAERISDAKTVIFEGFRKAVDAGAPKEAGGVLVDEQFGTDIARTAKKEGYLLAMPVEKSGQDEFDFQYGDDFGGHIEELDPSFSKVLVRWNPEGDQGMNQRQGARLKRLGDWLHAQDRKYLFELLVPAEPHQLQAVGGDADRYDKEVRPGLMHTAIGQIQDAGIEPDIWKIEGIDAREDCERISEQVRRDGRDGVACVVLGRGADDNAVIHWLQTGAGVPGYIGFAIGRTIWWDALKAFVDGESTREAASDQIGENYRRMIAAYNGEAERS
jgi:myo-inositol catabolism protein IolC